MAYDPVRTIELTEEEQLAFSACIRSLMLPGETMTVKSEFADEMQRGFCALAILGLADRLTTEGRIRNDPAAVSRGQTAAVKAVAIYPIAATIYECARILACSGKNQEARELFKEFLDRWNSEPAGPVHDRFTPAEELPGMVSGARLFLKTGIAPVT